jgi:hypothetical protein
VEPGAFGPFPHGAALYVVRPRPLAGEAR